MCIYVYIYKQNKIKQMAQGMMGNPEGMDEMMRGLNLGGAPHMVCVCVLCCVGRGLNSGGSPHGVCVRVMLYLIWWVGESCVCMCACSCKFVCVCVCERERVCAVACVRACAYNLERCL